MKFKKNQLPAILLCLSILCIIVGLVVLGWSKAGKLRSGATITASQEDVEEVISEASEEPVSDVMETSSEIDISDDASIEEVDISEPYEVEPEPEIVYVENPYKDYFLQNSDMAGWLKIPDTIVDYPVMWTPENETYYLFLDFNKKKSGNGCLLLDTDSSMYPLTTNLIIHGHNNKNAMFGDLDKYESKDYRDEHPYIYLYGKDYEHIYEVVAAFRSKVFYTTDVCFKYYKFFEANNEEELKDFIDNVKELSYYDTDIPVEFGDHLITLSTCSYHVDNGRFVVVAKEIEPGEYYESFEIINQ